MPFKKEILNRAVKQNFFSTGLDLKSQKEVKRLFAAKIGESTYMIRLAQGEELMHEMRAFCVRQNIRLGYFTGLGAVREAELGVFLHDEGRYDTQTFQGSLEILSLHGNITLKDDSVHLHVHLGIGDEAFRMYGGHLNRAVIMPTCEIILHVFDATVIRVRDEASGLSLLQLHDQSAEV